MKCPKCQTENPETKQFCGDCGTRIRGHVPDSPESGTCPQNSKDIHPELTETLQTPVHELTTGSTFAGRYQIIEELGKGGMGKVYKVFDDKIKEKIALKLIKSEIASDKETIERFSNELRLARKISHRNVCRMFDLGEAEGDHFITMEYVHGEDLKSMIRMTGMLGIGTVLSVGKQICDGLDEAHNLGVVHRDLKPTNIMIDKGGNAKIMDFGIARSIREKRITGPSVLIGTPEYMSPEQAEAKEVDQRSDIYSLGIILYEMATGRVPFEGQTALSVAMKHKGEIPKNPKQFNPDIPDDLSGVILKCLEKDKSKRYQSAGEVHAELEKIEKGIPTTERVVPERKTLTSREITVKFNLKKLFIPAVIIGLAICAAAIFFLRSRGPQYDSKRIIVSVFENQTGDKSLDPLGRVASDWITQGLSKTGLVEVLSVPPGETAPGTPKEEERIRGMAKESGAGTLVSGTYFLQGKTLSFHAQINNMSKAKLIKALDPVSSPVEEPLKAIELLRQKVMGVLAIIYNPRFGSFVDVLGQPPTYEAYKEYTEGSELFGRYDFKEAIGHFSRAAELDPSFKSPLLMAAVAYLNLGENAKAGELAKDVDKAVEKLGAVDRVSLDWLKADLQGDQAGSLRAARQGASMQRGAWNFQWAYEALDNNYPREAIMALSRLDPAGIWMNGWAEYWRRMTQGYHMLGKHKEELKQARRGRKQYPEDIDVLYFEVRALAALGKIAEINKLVDESFGLRPTEMSPGTMMFYAGEFLKVHGFKKEALQMLDRSIQWYKAKPRQELDKKEIRSELAFALYLAEKWEEARTLYEGLLKEEPANVGYFGYCGALAARRGDREEALRISAQLQSLKTPYLWGSDTYWRAIIAGLLEDKENAVRILREAIDQGVSYWNLYTDVDLEPLRDYPLFIELIKSKG